MQPKIKLISFDAGGTLLHPYPSVGKLYSEVMVKHGIHIAEEKLQKNFHQSFQHVQRSTLKTSEANELNFWKSIVKETLKGLAKPKDFDVLFKDLWQGFAKPGYWKLSDKCIDTLKELKNRKLQCVILSNWDSRLNNIIEGMSLAPYFEHTFISSEVGYNKPAPELFNHVENICKVSGQEILHVGDHIKNDIEPARKRNWQCLLYDPKDKHDSQHSIKSLVEVLDFI